MVRPGAMLCLAKGCIVAGECGIGQDKDDFQNRGAVDAMKKCNNCKQPRGAESYGTFMKNGVEVAHKSCISCRATQKRYSGSEKARAVRRKYNKSDKAKAANARYNNSDKTRANKKKYRKSSLGKQRAAEKRASELGKAIQKRSRETQSIRRKEDPAFKLKRNLQKAAWCLVSGRRKKSPTFVANTSFKSAAHFVRHMSKAVPADMSMKDYGDGWHVEHAIPQEAYDFSIPEDVKRCWSPANVRGFAADANNEKSWTIIDSLCAKVGVEHFPTAWNGTIPNEEQKKAFYAKCLEQYHR